VLVGAVVVSGGEGAPRFWRGGLDWVPATLGALAAFAAAGGANALNDALDAASDRLNAPGRPIPSGGATRAQAILVAAVMYAACVTLAWSVGPGAAAMAVAWVGLTTLYSTVLKGVPLVGNVVVSAVAASPLVMGGLTQRRFEPGLALLFAVAALLHLSRELFKDAEDAEGDRAEGVNTLAVARGPETAMALGRALMVVSMVAAIAPFLTRTLGPLYLVLLVPVEVTLFRLAATSLRGAAVATRARHISRWLKLTMVLGLVAFLGGSL